MASGWFPHLLALEVSTTTRQAQGASRSSAADPRDEPGKSSLGRSSHPWRTPQARHRCRPDFGCQVHGPTAPERICQAHLANQLPNFETHLGPAGSPSRLQRQKVRNPARCHRTIVSGRTIVTASRTVGVSRYSNIKIRRSNALRAGRLGVLRRSTFNWCRSAITSASSELLARKRSRRIHLSRLKSSSTRLSSSDSGAQTKRMEFAAGTPGCDRVSCLVNPEKLPQFG